MKSVQLGLGLAALLASPAAADTRTIGEPAGSGPYPAVAEVRADAPDHIIYRAADMPAHAVPLVLWGNGGCRDNGLSVSHFLREIASHGYVVVANGKAGEELPALDTLAPPPPSAGPPPAPRQTADETTVAGMLAAIEWAEAASAAGGFLAGKVDVTRIAAMGHSCGGLQALAAGADPRVTTVVAFASGVYNRPGSGLSGVRIGKDDLAKLHTPVAYVIGGPEDIAYPNAVDDFERIGHVPVMLANLPVGHGGTFRLVDGGDWARVGTAWLDWQLKGDAQAARWFVGSGCRMCTTFGWSVQRKQFPGVSMTKPLEGYRVADFSHVMAGPYATHLLCLLGAEVIKIESPAGDAFRSYRGDRRFDGMSPAFVAANAGKKSIALDLKDSGDHRIARGIIERCDVLIENFRPGVIGRLGFSYDEVRAFNPEIVFCSVSGYGQDGPYRDWPAIDNIVQATSGMMMLGGGEGDPPVRVGFPIVDTLTGQTAAIAILSALLRRERGEGGSYIDVSMLDASLAFMTSALTPYLLTGEEMPRMGNTGYSGLPGSALYTARDGRQVSLGVVLPKQFEMLARYLGREDWLADPRFATSEAQRTNFDALHDQIAAEIAKRDAAGLEQELSDCGIPCGMVRRVGEAAALVGEGALQDIELGGVPASGRGAVPNAGFRLAPDGPAAQGAPPRLDQDRDEILAWLAEPVRG